VEDQRQHNDAIKNPLKNLLDDFYEGTAKISEISRNFAFAGIGIIWIFKNSKVNEQLLPIDLIFPLKCIIIYFILDFFQYVWRSINCYIIYKSTEKKYDKKLIDDHEIGDIKFQDYIEIGSWSFFIFKILFLLIAFGSIYSFLNI